MTMVRGHWFNIVTLVISVVSLLIAVLSWNAATVANTLSSAANQVAERANALSVEANQIAKESVTPQVVILESPYYILIEVLTRLCLRPTSCT